MNIDSGGNENCSRMGLAMQGWFLAHVTLQLTGWAQSPPKSLHKSNTHTTETHISLLPTSMGRTSGNWGTTKDKLLGDLLRSNTIDYRNRTVEYLFSVTEEHFPDFISPGVSGKNSAIQRIQNKLVCYKQDLLARGVWGKSCCIVCVDFSSNWAGNLPSFCLRKETTTTGDEEEAKEMPAVPVPPTRPPAPTLLSK
jgi:hypothetical protein